MTGAGLPEVIAPVPLLDEPGLHGCTLRSERFGRPLECTLPADEFRASNSGLHAFIADLKTEFPASIWIEPWSLMCDQSACQTEMNGVPLYKDGGHLNDIGSRVLAREWIKKFGNPLKLTQRGAEASH